MKIRKDIAAAFLLAALMAMSFAFLRMPTKTVDLAGREAIIVVPDPLPETDRALVVVFHGGLVDARHIQKELGMDRIARDNGFIVAYLNGSKAFEQENDLRRKWGAKEDAAYVRDAIKNLQDIYNVKPSRTFALGQSSGAIMMLTMVCETDLFPLSVSVSGTVSVTECPSAGGKKILAIHGADDEVVPFNGGVTALSLEPHKSQSQTQAFFKKAGADYTIEKVEGAGHWVPSLDENLKGSTGKSLAETAAAFFGLAGE